MSIKISDELLAAYAEGKVTKEERNQVRQYLSENPRELESVMMMMDEDYELTVEDDIDKMGQICNIGTIGHGDGNRGIFTDISLSSAAFAPNAPRLSMNVPNRNQEKKMSTFNSRLDNLLDDLGI